jgi:hypothetical protein
MELAWKAEKFISGYTKPFHPAHYKIKLNDAVVSGGSAEKCGDGN